MPDVYDFHVHIGEVIGGNQLAHDWKSLNKICQEEGIKGIGAFVTEEASARLIDKYSAMLAESKRYFQGRVHWHLSPTHSSLEELLPLLVGGCDLKFYTTYEAAGLYTSYQRIGEWMQDLKSVSALQESGLPRLLIHCEDNGIIRECSARHPFKHPWDHTLRRPEKAENIAVERILELALEHQYPVHIVHVSSPQSALLIHQAKQNSSSHPNGYPSFPTLITCETAPHYLIYSSERLKVKQAHRYLCSPPYRSEQSRGELVELLQDGYFDLIASDHCPFPDVLKDSFKHKLEDIPIGIPGLATLYSSTYQALVQSNKISPDYLNELLCLNPQALMSSQVRIQV